MQRSLLAVAIISALFFTGCASVPTAQELAAADYGTPIGQEEAQAKAQAYLKTVLKDPLSAQYEWSPIDRGWIRLPLIQGNKMLYGYKLDANINAKNSYGGYNGFKPYYFLFQNGELVGVWGQGDMGNGQTMMVRMK